MDRIALLFNLRQTWPRIGCQRWQPSKADHLIVGLEDKMKEIQIEITRNLVSAATGYARAGMGLMFGTMGLPKNAQAAIGNLAIATELLLKAFIAKQDLTLLFTGLPLELRCALAAPETMHKSFRALPYEIELKSSSYKSIELDEAIATFCIFFPEFKKRLGSHLRFLARHRNTCVHAVHPDFREYEAERTAFLFLTLVKHIESEDTGLVRFRNWGEEKQNEAFLTYFDESRLNRVHEKVEAARKIAKTLTKKVSLEPEEWDWYPVECPVCGSDGIVQGETQEEIDVDEDGFGGLSLSFVAETFECEQCGLQLEDYDEMKIAGVSPDDIDRSDESNQWQEDHYADSYDQM